MIKELINKAIQAREKSYSPYSNFKVGASVMGESGKIYSGCNIENAAYSPTICAERVAIFKAISNGEREIKKIALIGSTDSFTYPCGVCRQVMTEFASDDFEIIVAKNIEEYVSYSLDDLMPNSFRARDMGR
ncbi:MAG: cytidine deaminase [Tissierellia bacterium]|nr:cytidine deaminase [Tissierellia bacterium]